MTKTQKTVNNRRQNIGSQKVKRERKIKVWRTETYKQHEVSLHTFRNSENILRNKETDRQTNRQTDE